MTTLGEDEDIDIHEGLNNDTEADEDEHIQRQLDKGMDDFDDTLGGSDEDEEFDGNEDFGSYNDNGHYEGSYKDIGSGHEEGGSIIPGGNNHSLGRKYFSKIPSNMQSVEWSHEQQHVIQQNWHTSTPYSNHCLPTLQTLEGEYVAQHPDDHEVEDQSVYDQDHPRNHVPLMNVNNSAAMNHFQSQHYKPQEYHGHTQGDSDLPSSMPGVEWPHNQQNDIQRNWQTSQYDKDYPSHQTMGSNYAEHSENDAHSVYDHNRIPMAEPASLNHFPAQNYKPQEYHGGDSAAAVREDSEVYHQTYDISHVNAAKDIHLSANERFFRQIGSREDGLLAQKEILNQQKDEEIKRLSEQLAELKSSERILKHANGIISKEKDELESNFKLKICDFEHISKELHALKTENESLKADKKKLLAEVEKSEDAINDLQAEVKSLSSMETLAQTKRYYDNLITKLEHKHESQISALTEELNSYKSKNINQEGTIQKLSKKLDESEKEFQGRELKRNEIINQLTKSLEEAQEQCHKMLAKGSKIPEIAQEWESKLEEAVKRQKQAEEMSKSLAEENAELKGQLIELGEQTLETFLNEIISLNQKETQVPDDDSYLQLNIKRPSRGTRSLSVALCQEELEEFFKSKMIQMKKLTTVFTSNKLKVASLQEDLRKAQDQVKKYEDELQEIRNQSNDLIRNQSDSKNQTLCGGACSDVVSKLKHELRNARDLLKKVSSSKKALELELHNKEAAIKDLQVNVDELKNSLTNLFQEHEEDKRKALEKCEAKWMEHFDNAIHAKEKEIKMLYDNELSSARSELSNMEVRLADVQTSYLECCEERKKFEAELNAVWERKLKEMLEEKQSEISSLSKFYDAMKKKSKVTTVDFSVQTEITPSSKAIQVENEGNLSDRGLVELKQMIAKLQSSISSDKEQESSDSMRLEFNNKVKEKEDIITKLNQDIQAYTKDIDKLRKTCSVLQEKSKNREVETWKKAEEEMLSFLKDLIVRSGTKGEISFDENWSWMKKFEYLLSLRPDASDRNVPVDDEVLSKVMNLTKKIEAFEKESISYVTLNTNLKDRNLALMMQLGDANAEREKLLKRLKENESLMRGYEAMRQELEKCKLEKTSLMSILEKTEGKVQMGEKEIKDMVTKLEKMEADKAVQFQAWQERENKLKQDKQQLIGKLTESSKLFEKLEAASQKRLKEMNESMEREKQEAVRQLREMLELKEKEKKVLHNVLKQSEHKKQKEIADLQRRLEEVLLEKKALEKSDLGELLEKYKTNVEVARQFYNERILELERKRRKYDKACEKASKIMRDHYLFVMHKFLTNKFNSDTALEILAHVQAHLDSLPTPEPDEETSSRVSTKDFPPSPLELLTSTNQRASSCSTVGSKPDRPASNLLSHRLDITVPEALLSSRHKKIIQPEKR